MPITREFLASIGQAFNSRDVDRIMALFHEDAIFWLASGPEPVGTTLSGKARNAPPTPGGRRRNAWLGAGAKILDGVTLGANVVIGAGAVVNESLPDSVIAAGVPAKIIKRRDALSPERQA